jgi:hypothetical protein
MGNPFRRLTLKPPPLWVPLTGLLLAAAVPLGHLIAPQRHSHASARAATVAELRGGGLSARPTTPGELLLGQSAALSGPSGQLGEEVRLGALAWVAEITRRGGIHGRRIRLVSLDDRYEPALTLANTRHLIADDQVFALFGYVGTPTVKAALPLLEAQGIPLIAPLTGARLLRVPHRPLVFNLRAGYQLEIDRMVDVLVRDGRHRIAVLHQSDAFGADGLAASRSALRRHGLQPVAVASVVRNSTDVKAAGERILAADPNAVIVVSAYPGSAAFALLAQSRGSDAQLMNVSFVGTRPLQDALSRGQANGIGVAQVVPFPWDRRVPVVVEYQRLMARVQTRPRYGFNSMEGFLAARLVSEGLQRAGRDPSRQQLVQALESIRDLDLGGFRLRLGPRDHEAGEHVELVYLGAQPWEP